MFLVVLIENYNLSRPYDLKGDNIPREGTIKSRLIPSYKVAKTIFLKSSFLGHTIELYKTVVKNAIHFAFHIVSVKIGKIKS